MLSITMDYIVKIILVSNLKYSKFYKLIALDQLKRVLLCYALLKLSHVNKNAIVRSN
jgi:hypothetical protein